ncbi:MAG TPA: hypothetical protein VF720_03620 [Candidatus Eisenbacteria bacterium]
MRIAILTLRALPRFITREVANVDEFFADDRRLIAEFDRFGVSAEAVSWGDPDVDWNSYDIAIIRSTWDYIDARDEFLAVLKRIEASSCRLINPLDTVRWNSDKVYLTELYAQGIPTVPTYRAGLSHPFDLHRLLAEHGWDDAVIKPRVGAAGFGVRRVSLGELRSELQELRAAGVAKDFIVQPLIETIREEGEWSFIFIDGRFSHLVRKRPAAGDYRINTTYGGTDEVATPRPDHLAEAGAIMARIDFRHLYARLDLVRIGADMVIMEVELIEPFLYFDHAPESVARFVDAVLRPPSTDA